MGRGTPLWEARPFAYQGDVWIRSCANLSEAPIGGSSRETATSRDPLSKKHSSAIGDALHSP